MSRARRARCVGSILFEGAWVLVLLVPAMLLSVEWARRGWVDVALAAGACAVARDVRWGVVGTRAFRRALPLFEAALGASGAAALRRGSHPLVETRGRGALARLHFRGALLWRFRGPQSERHHFEVTHRCLSP